MNYFSGEDGLLHAVDARHLRDPSRLHATSRPCEDDQKAYPAPLSHFDPSMSRTYAYLLPASLLIVGNSFLAVHIWLPYPSCDSPDGVNLHFLRSLDKSKYPLFSPVERTPNASGRTAHFPIPTKRDPYNDVRPRIT
jgi:hypothetical protein